MSNSVEAQDWWLAESAQPSGGYVPVLSLGTKKLDRGLLGGMEPGMSVLYGKLVCTDSF